jgi:hypothetical protein
MPKHPDCRNAPWDVPTANSQRRTNHRASNTSMLEALEIVSNWVGGAQTQESVTV